MLAVNIGNVIVETVDGTLKCAGVLQGAAARTENRVNAPKGVPRQVGIANRADALADEAVVEIIDQRGGNNGGITGNQALVVVHDVGDRRLTRQERGGGLVLIGERPPEGQALR